MIVAQTARSGSVGSETRLLELDGLRGIAILMVIVCHYVFAPALAQAAPSSPRVFAFQIFSSGVDLFFVLSGFLIGGILLDHRNSPSYFRTFYGRRVFRIFPVYYGFLLLTAAAGIVLHMRGKPTPVFDAGTPYWMFVLFLQNFSIAWFGDNGWITTSMAWSLALEEQFYLTLPLAVRKLSTRTLIGISALVIAGAPVLRYFLPGTPHSLGTLVLSAVRADGLAAGFLCAALVRSERRLSAGLLGGAALILAGTVAAAHLAGSRIGFLRETALLSFYGCILLLAVRGSVPILQSSFLRFFGTISYTLYLVHQSALVLLHVIVPDQVPSAIGAKAIFASSAALVLSIGFCWISWVYFEKPVLEWARRQFDYRNKYFSKKRSASAKAASQ